MQSYSDTIYVVINTVIQAKWFPNQSLKFQTNFTYQYTNQVYYYRKIMWWVFSYSQKYHISQIFLNLQPKTQYHSAYVYLHALIWCRYGGWAWPWTVTALLSLICIHHCFITTNLRYKNMEWLHAICSANPASPLGSPGQNFISKFKK